MATPVENRSSNKFCDFYNDKGHNTDECMQLKKKIEELVRAGKLSHLIKEIKHGRDKSKVEKKEAPAKDKPTTIYMIQSWQRMTRQKVTQSFERVREITFPSLATNSRTEGPLVIEAKIGGHIIPRMYVDGGSSTEVLYEHCFNRIRPEVNNQMVPAPTSLTGFSGETIWPLGQLRLLVTIGDVDHSTRAWINFMIVRSLSPYNGIIGRLGIKEIQAVPSTSHGMLKFPSYEGIVTIRNTILIPAECTTMITSSKEIPKEAVTPAQYPGGIFTRSAKEKGPGPGMRQGHPSRGLLPLPEIDCKVESLYGYPFKCFLDAYKGYHQIQLAESDEEKTAFHTGQGNIKVYIDDLVIKSHTEAEMLRDIGEMFRTLRKVNMKINPKKCTFGVVERMFLGYMITPERIKPFPDKTEAVLQLQSPRTINEKCIKKSNFHWTLEAKQAFKQLKQHLSELPLLVAPKPKEELIIYPSASYRAISAVLKTERGMVQTPVYFLSHALQGLKLNYTPMEKLALSLVFAAKRLQRRSFLTPWLRCVGPLQAYYVIREIHEGSCSMHAEPRSVVAKAIRLGYYWPKMHRDAQDMIQRPGKVKFLIVAMDYFTKWIETKAVATITGNQVKKFVWDNIVCHLGLSGEIVLDNNKQLSDNPFKDWCDKLNMTQRFASLKHPQSNGLVERANQSLGEGIKARLGEENKNWDEELPYVLWAHRTMIKSSHGDKPFSLTYGTEVVISAEIGMPTYRIAEVDVVHNDEELRLNLDLIEERRERDAIREAKAS
nr:reverse transcriptase domain-containing protein [Tanacetum cinerariifolium]